MGHWTESHQISTRCTKMTSDYSAEIKIVIFQSVLKRRRDECRTSSNCGRIAAKIARFNSKNSKIVGRKFTKFGYYVAWVSPLNCWMRIYDRSIRCWMLKERVKVVLPDTDCTISYGITEPNLTKFLQGVQKWLPITLLKSKLRSSNPFGNANVTNEDWRSSSNCGQIAGKIGRFNSVNSQIIERTCKFIKFGYNVAQILPFNLLKADLWLANPLLNAEARKRSFLAMSATIL